MNPLELRKIIGVGLRYKRIDGEIVLNGPDNEPLGIDERPRTMRVAFWIPQRQPFQRRGVEFRVNPVKPRPGELQDPLEGCTLVHDVQDFELQAMRDGAIREEIFDFEYPKRPTHDEVRRDLMPIWEKLTLEALGYLPLKPPDDKDPKFSVLFTAIPQIIEG